MGRGTWTIVVAGGSGTRFGARKQYLRLGGRRVLDWALDAAAAHSDGVVLVVPADVADEPEAKADVVVAGGATRSASVRAGLAAVPDEAAVIVVHDAARPVPVPHVWRAVLEAVAAGADAAVPGVPVTDTLRSIHGGVVDRSSLVAVQTPQAFRAAALRAAHADGGDATDDASLVEARGGNVVLVDGDPRNVKITTPADLSVAELHCR
ncbi:MAG TPA: 2-C-methyl-D-erythritol 4-phosphate cytidylyltransferase [Acidimicrobiales bacterium]|nr:2-C-methyl-D-erythritol 4-phosphate cytidylyltransferase [Acidimicrobiales bacterium]